MLKDSKRTHVVREIAVMVIEGRTTIGKANVVVNEMHASVTVEKIRSVGMAATKALCAGIGGCNWTGVI